MIERTARSTAPGVVALFLTVGVVLSERPAVVAVSAAVLAVLVCAALAHRAVTGAPAVAGLVVAGVAVSIVAGGTAGNVGWFALCALAGWTAVVAGPVSTAVLTALAVASFGVQWSLDAAEIGWASWMSGTVFTVVACAMARRQRDLLAQLQEAQQGLAARAAAEERNRIAHELHDVIGHALTVSLLHVTSARLALDEDPAEAAASLAQAERLAQQSLAEVRAVVGLMKDTGPTTPLPGAADLDRLVDSFTRAGTAVDWSVSGDATDLTAAEGLTVYRILQEALTNVACHAPSAPVTARLVLTRDRTRVLVDSHAPPADVVRDGTGVTGMRQRAEALGGALSAGPHDGGWRVEAVLPS